MKKESRRLLRLSEVLDRFPVSRSRWYDGIAAGEFPRPVRLGISQKSRSVAWREADIDELIRKLPDGNDKAA